MFANKYLFQRVSRLWDEQKELATNLKQCWFSLFLGEIDQCLTSIRTYLASLSSEELLKQAISAQQLDNKLESIESDMKKFDQEVTEHSYRT